jgi:hypothetical protein
MPEVIDIVSMLGEREKAAELPPFSGGKEVCRRGWVDVADVVDIIEALRRLIVGAEEGISDCLRFSGWGSCAFDG